MTLPINILQSIVARNRTTITGLHELVSFWKAAPNTNYISVDAAVYYKQAAKYSKDIAKLALLQKKLKREISEQIVAERDRRNIKRVMDEFVAARGSAFKEVD